MSCPHGRHSTPATCSLCAGAKPRVVTHAAGELLIDGVPARPFDPGSDAPLPRARQRDKNWGFGAGAGKRKP